MEESLRLDVLKAFGITEQDNNELLRFTNLLLKHFYPGRKFTEQDIIKYNSIDNEKNLPSSIKIAWETIERLVKNIIFNGKHNGGNTYPDFTFNNNGVELKTINQNYNNVDTTPSGITINHITKNKYVKYNDFIVIIKYTLTNQYIEIIDVIVDYVFLHYKLNKTKHTNSFIVKGDKIELSTISLIDFLEISDVNNFIHIYNTLYKNTLYNTNLYINYKANSNMKTTSIYVNNLAQTKNKEIFIKAFNGDINPSFDILTESIIDLFGNDIYNDMLYHNTDKLAKTNYAKFKSFFNKKLIYTKSGYAIYEKLCNDFNLIPKPCKARVTSNNENQYTNNVNTTISNNTTNNSYIGCFDAICNAKRNGIIGPDEVSYMLNKLNDVFIAA